MAAKATPTPPRTEKRQQADAAVAWARLNPNDWVRKFLRLEPDAWQAELLDAVADLWRIRKGVPTVVNHAGHNLVTVRAMHGPGKTFGMALLMHWFAYCWPTLSPCTAPKQKQLTTRLWPAFRKAMKNAVPGYSKMIKVDQQRISWHNDKDWAFVAETAATPENLQGYHDDFMLIPVEEASGVPEEMYPALEGALSTGKLVCMVLIGNPTRNVGTFYDSHMREIVSRNYYRIHVSLEKTTRVSRQWVQRMIDKYGKDSPVVQVRCFGNFASMDELQLIALQWIVDACEREFDDLYDGSIPRTRISADVADGGQDACVITLADHYATFVHVRKQWQFWFPSSKAPMLCADEIIKLWNELKLTSANADVVVDALGVGAGCAGAVMLATDPTGKPLNIPVIAYKGGETEGVNTGMYRNRRVQSHMGMRNDLRDGRVVFHPEFVQSLEERSEFEAQCCSIRIRHGTERVDDLETKDQMRKLGIKSPDRAESLAMQYATDAPALAGRALPNFVVDSELLTAHSEAARADW